MKCKHIKEILLTDYLDGELSLLKQADIESHLSNCPSCKEFLGCIKKDLQERLKAFD